MSYEKNLVLCRFYGKSIPKVITVLEGVVSQVGYHPQKRNGLNIYNIYTYIYIYIGHRHLQAGGGRSYRTAMQIPEHPV